MPGGGGLAARVHADVATEVVSPILGKRRGPRDHTSDERHRADDDRMTDESKVLCHEIFQMLSYEQYQASLAFPTTFGRGAGTASRVSSICKYYVAYSLAVGQLRLRDAAAAQVKKSRR
jgi:hypothetical protein